MAPEDAMRRIAVTVLVGALALTVWHVARRADADDGDDTLKRWLARSDVVVDATVRSLDGPRYLEAGVAHYGAALDVHETLAGDPLEAPSREAGRSDDAALPRVAIVRFERVDADRLPYLEEGARVVLFLRRAPGRVPRYETSDSWLGVQPYGPWLARRLAALAAP
jgi:hypothetical protein